MSGQLAVVARQEPLHHHVRTIFELENGDELRFTDQRKFGKVYLTHEPNLVLGKLGVEPLTEAFSVSHFQTLLAGRKIKIKPFC